MQALKGVSLSLDGGELTLLMGPSGSGKTTLLSVLGCMLTPTEGTVRVRGQSTTGAARGAGQAQARPYRLCLSILSSVSDADAPSTMSGWRWMCAASAARRAVGKAKEVLATVGLSHKVNAFPRELSGGEQQRVAIARAIVGDASAILADEPTAALDSENGHAIMTILAEIAKDPSRGVLVVTHDPRILPFADRIVRIEDGRIVGEEQGGACLAHRTNEVIANSHDNAAGTQDVLGRTGPFRRCRGASGSDCVADRRSGNGKRQDTR